MHEVPSDLQARNETGQLHVAWPDRTTDFSLVALRGKCECAQCVNEWTGERMYHPENVPAGITIETMELVGNYAARVRWSDGHHTGLFTWKRLRELSEEMQE